MRPKDRGVDELHAVWGLFGKGFKYLNPDPCLGPAIEPVVDDRVGALALGQVAPRRAGSRDPDPVQNPPIVDPRYPTGLVGKKWLDQSPLHIRFGNWPMG